jgi:hypothetical protein
MSSIRSSKQFAAATALAVTLGIVGTPAQARLPADGSTKGVAVTAITPMQDVARSPASDTRLPRLAIQWSGSNGGDDTPTEDHPF